MSYAVFRKSRRPAANEKNSNEKCPIHLLTRKKENKPQVFFANIPCYTVLSLLNHKTHQYTNTPRFFSGESHTACFPKSRLNFPTSEEYFKSEHFVQHYRAGYIAPPPPPVSNWQTSDRSRKRKRNRREEEEEEEMTQNRREKKQISISDTFIS